MSPDEIASMISLQAVKLFPAGEALVTGSRIIERDARGSSLVNVVLAQDEIVKGLLNTMTEAGASIEDVFLDVYGFEGYLTQHIATKEVLFLIHIEDGFCQAAVLKGGRICVSRGFSVMRQSAGWQEKLITQLIETQSIYVKQDNGASIKSVCLAVPDQRERQEYLAFFRDHLPQKIDLLTLPGVNAVNVRTAIAGYPDSIMGLVGFILRRPESSLSLIPMNVRKKRAETRVARHGARIIVTAILAALLFSAAGVRFISQKKAYLSRLEKELAEVRRQSASIEKRADKIAAVRESSREKGNVLDFLTAVHQVAPGGMIIEELQYDMGAAEHYSVFGYSNDRDSVFAFATKLGEFAIFSSPAEVKYADRVDSPEGEIIKFKIVFARK